MKAISAVILTRGLSPGEVAAAGVMIGIALFVLGITGAVENWPASSLNRSRPASSLALVY
jgi:hypothetical protein